MKKLLILTWSLFSVLAHSQLPENGKEEKIRKAFSQAEAYLEKDEIDVAQKWLNLAQDLIDLEAVDTMTCYVNSLQSELFYYTALYEFGKNQAQKSIDAATKINDPLLVADAYFFKAINQFELKEFANAEKSLQLARHYYPLNPRKHTLRSVIQPDHIANNLAQVKLKINQPDSALYYNRNAYRYAQKTKSRRGIPNCEQTFGEIYLYQNRPDSARYYFSKSILSARNSAYSDLELIGYGFLMQCNAPTLPNDDYYYQSGLELMQRKSVNLAFRRLFFEKSLLAYRGQNPEKENFILNQLIVLNGEISELNNYFLQSITKDYIKNEHKILSLEVQRLKKEKDIVFFQLLMAIFFVLALILTVIIIRRRNKINLQLLQQKNEISKDLHDDIGSGLSSILIHSDVLQKQTANTPELQLLSDKINQTATEISQRVSTFVWSLNDKHNTVASFTDYFLSYAENLFEGTSIDFRCHSDLGPLPEKPIDGKLRKNLFLALKEILNNTLKHAQATQVEARITGLRNHLHITLCDNGKGFQRENAFGNGLTNIRNRIEESGGKISFEHTGGLRIVIEIPF
ncbi:hypothetical protein G4D82_05550 [Flavobacterium sp. CYK-4]|uniref:sensor histidine kinase n=1 Tax=Flavobacterium lotistagni TaxID=2709660 RepID=UPI0014072CE1|nr:ATP-binding protein [Flavobacterium lotistagni]NHM06677.1 hypothetical protein [Flavobacterium lotistagni]